MGGIGAPTARTMLPMTEANTRSLHDPIRQATTVRSGREHAFEVFVRRIGDWWPTETHSLGQEKVVAVHFEEELGGRVYETWGDGHQREWGRVITWEPPERFAITWQTLSQTTEVELRFRELAPALTRVEVEHRGWERLPAEEVIAWTTPPSGYSEGWRLILARFEEAATESATEVATEVATESAIESATE